MTLQIQSDHVYTQLGVPVSVTGVAQVTNLLFCVNYFFNVLDSIFDCSLVKGRDAADVTKFQFSQSLLYHLSINNLSVKLNPCQSV